MPVQRYKRGKGEEIIGVIMAYSEEGLTQADNEELEEIRKKLPEITASLDAVGTPKRNDNGYWPIKSTRDEVSIRNPGLDYFREMDKKEKRYP